MTETSDYQRVERAIHFITQRSPAQPSLADVADHVGLSEFHFQRLFARWAGTTPKRFAQFLTVEHAKTVLKQSRNLLDASFASGLSGAGRLHDLFVTTEAVTPGDFRREGDGLTILHGRHKSPFGEVLVATTTRGICGLFFLSNNRDEEKQIEGLRRQWPAAALRRDGDAGRKYADRIFSIEPGGASPIPLLLNGTNFQINVWKALLKIPAGTLVTYQQLAAAAGTPGAVRAVGTAVGRNPISFLIPCHRVIRKSGAFGNYGGGVDRKKALLAWEASRFSNDAAAL
jgi:AraC family transcriptional regulator of adaptative response/methylated-DNA-[protein]-cysteine methyltransferase